MPTGKHRFLTKMCIHGELNMELACATFLFFPRIYFCNIWNKPTPTGDLPRGPVKKNILLFCSKSLLCLVGQKGILQLRFSSEMEHSFQLCRWREEKNVIAWWHRWLLRKQALAFKHVRSLSVWLYNMETVCSLPNTKLNIMKFTKRYILSHERLASEIQRQKNTHLSLSC